MCRMAITPGYTEAVDFSLRESRSCRHSTSEKDGVGSREVKFISPELHAKLTRGHLQDGDVLHHDSGTDRDCR